MNRMQRLIEEIKDEVSYTSARIGRCRLASEVIAAMEAVPRHKFVPPELQDEAYANHPLPIGHGQTISQPYIVALMTDLLELRPDDIVLEVGTGSGYQSAVLSQVCRQVYTIEVIPELVEATSKRLRELGYNNIKTCLGNGYHGWQEHAPYDGIIVTAAASHIPQALIDQLKPGGKMAIPIGMPYSFQELVLVEKDTEGHVEVSGMLGVAFVPMKE